MTDTKELLQRIAALRQRLNQAEPTVPTRTVKTHDPLRAIDAQVQLGSRHNTLIDGTLRAAEPSTPPPATVRLTARGARLLRQGREMLQALRKISEHAEFQAAEQGDFALELHHEATAMLETLLRTAQMFPPTVSLQLRLCDGLEVLLSEIEKRLGLVCSILGQRQRRRRASIRWRII